LKPFLTAAALLTLLAASPAGAVTFYTTQASFDAAVIAPVVVEDFEAAGQPLDTVISGFSHNGLTFTGLAGVPSPNVYLLAAGTTTGFGAGISVPITSNILAANGDEDIRVTLDAPAQAIGFDVYLNGLGPLAVGAYNGDTLLDTYTFPGSDNGQTYLGMVSDTAITSFRFTSSLGASLNTAMDNITIASVPEPASLALLASGCMAAALRRRRGT
jgi:hypothetical protein